MKTRNLWVSWLATLLLCTILGALFALPNLTAAMWKPALLSSLAQWWSWALIAPLIFWVDSRLPLRANQLLLRILMHLPISVVITLVYFYTFLLTRACLGLTAWKRLADTNFLPMAFQNGLLWSWLVYWIIFGVLQTFRYYEHYLAGALRIERMERNLSEARLNALRMQLDPHFLFNALNTISSQVDRDPRLARGMIEHLGDLLRLSLEARDRQQIPLAEELAFLDHYVAIQKIRFAQNLRIEINVAPEVRYALVPCLILQPLVENAIRHGISSRSSGGLVTVTATSVSNRLEIRVTDDGVGLPAGWSLETSSGMGLSVTRERIVGLHPSENARFSVSPHTRGGAEVEIHLPLVFAEEGTNGAVG